MPKRKITVVHVIIAGMPLLGVLLPVIFLLMIALAR